MGGDRPGQRLFCETWYLFSSGFGLVLHGILAWPSMVCRKARFDIYPGAA